MDQGRAAVYGALVGVLGTLLGSCITWLQLRTQAKASNAQWRRQVQRDSYGLLIEKVDSVRKTFEPIQRRARTSECTAADHDLIEATGPTLADDVDAASIVVMLEGPAPIAELGIQVSHALRAWGAALQDLIKAVIDGEADLEDKQATEHAASLEAGELVGTFLLTARRHLDQV